MIRSSIAVSLALVLVTLVASRPARGQGEVLYGALGGTTLVRIDASTLKATTVGTIGFSGVGGLAFGVDGTLYGMVTSGTDQLIKIDINTGKGTAVGPTLAPITFSTGMANDPSTDKLFGVTTQGVGPSGFLVNVSKANGAVTSIADTQAAAIVGLDFDANGQLWGIDGNPEELIKINKLTAATVIVGSRGLAAYAGIGCFDIGANGTFRAVNRGTNIMQLITINPNDGKPTLVGTITGIGSGVMTGLASRSTALLSASGTTRPGGTVAFDLRASADGGLVYQLGSSLGTGPIPIDSRLLRLSPDSLLVASTSGTLPTIFWKYAGTLDAQGLAKAALNIPSIPALIGVRLHSAFVTVTPSAPSGIQSISNTFSFSITK